MLHKGHLLRFATFFLPHKRTDITGIWKIHPFENQVAETVFEGSCKK